MILQFANPTAMTFLPFVVGAIFFITFIRFKKNSVPILRRLILSVGFSCLVALLMLALAQPFIIMDRQLDNVPELEVIVDVSASMEMYGLTADEVTGQLDGVVPYTLTTFGEEKRTPFLRTLLTKMRPHTNILVVSDGRDTEDDVTYAEILEQAQQVNARIHKVELIGGRDEQSVYLEGPQTSLAGIENTYRVGVGGEGPYEYVTVDINGQEVFRASPGDPMVFTHTFSTEGVQELVATISTQRDFLPENNVFHKTTRIIPKPKILYVGSDQHMLTFLEQFTDVTQRNNLQTNLSPYTAVITHNLPSAQLGDLTHLEDFVSEGNGLLVLGGSQSFEYSNYDGSSLAPLLPVQSGKSGDQSRAAVVLVIDVSASGGSTNINEFSDMPIGEFTQLLAYSIVESLSGENLLGVVAFYQEAYLVSDLQPLGPNRENILDRISRLRFDHAGTQINKGLLAGWQVADKTNGPKNIILISDGLTGGSNDASKTLDVADQLGAAGVRVFPVAILGDGEQTGEGTLRQIAQRTGGLYVEPLETEDLQIIFGDRQNDELDYVSRIGLQVSPYPHPISSTVTQLNSVLSSVNYVVPKRNAQVVLSTTNGDPAMVSWRYGLGRVVTMTAFTGQESMGSLMTPPDSRLLARTVSFVIGDPEKKLPPTIRIDDTRLGKPARVTATGPLPAISELAFTSLAPDLHVSYIMPNDIGFLEAYGATFAVAYPLEIQYMTPDPRLDDIIEATGGKAYRVQTLREIQYEMEQMTHVRENQPLMLHWVVLMIAGIFLILFILIRKLEEKRK